MRVVIVGHSQLPRNLDHNLDDVEVKIFRAPGARASRFNTITKLKNVLEYSHDVTILWIGSNDIDQETQPRQLAETIIQVAETIEERCGSRVTLVEVECREYPRGSTVISNEGYRRVKRSVNRALSRSRFTRINFGAIKYTLATDGVHFETSAKEEINKELVNHIKNFTRVRTD